MNQSIARPPEPNPPRMLAQPPRDMIWAVLIGISFVASMALAYRPALDSGRDAGYALLPWLVLAGLLAAWSGRTLAVRVVGISIAMGGWFLLAAADDRWTLLSFALYGCCFIVDSDRLRIGVTLAAVVSAIWLLASLDGPTWTLVIPLLVLAGASTIAFVIHRIGTLTTRQAELIRDLEAAQESLAVSERSRGTLEERARMAGEIHDTLAQGLTSIVLLARAGRRPTTDTKETLDSIESMAQENLDTARRLVESSRPVELSSASLPDALRRHLHESLPDHVGGSVNIVGTPRPLPGSVETVLLRTAQEGIRNACSHGEPSRVDVTLSYLGDAVTLGVSDDGIGLGPGEVHDRGTLTGGQGLATLSRRVESLDGRLQIGPGETRGSVLTVRLPVES
ncbi:MAG: sensor histidine kinase [Acidimicrobiia bacterium]|nr:sensor histidine kinase [Acidimicrobiia bacterium]